MTTADSSITLPESVLLNKYPKIPTYTVIICIYIEVYLCDPVKGSTAKRRERNFSDGMEQQSTFAPPTKDQRIANHRDTQCLLHLFPEYSLLSYVQWSPLFEMKDYFRFSCLGLMQ